MIALQASEALEGVATSATTVTYTVTGLEMTTASPPVANGYKVLAQGQMAASAGSMYSPSSVTALISSIFLLNTGGSAQTVSLYLGGTAGSNQIVSFVIPAGGWVQYEDGTGWTVYTASGLVVGINGAPGGIGTPDSSTVACTASTRVLIPGTSVALATNQLFVGNIFRLRTSLSRTAAGTATWTAIVAFGTANTTSDSAIATFTSGTNTAAIDNAILDIHVRILTLGGTATAACTAFYAHGGGALGFGQIPLIPGSTASFNSAATSPFLHVDITSGASAVVTAVGAAERLV